MESTKFRENHLFTFLNRFEETRQPLDGALNSYLRQHKNIGSHDRRFLGDTIYTLMRWKGLLDCIIHFPCSWKERYQILQSLDFNNLPSKNIPIWAECGASEWFFQKLEKAYGFEKAKTLCRILNETAPLTVRANTLKISRDDLLLRFQKNFRTIPCKEAPSGIQFLQKEPLVSLTDWKEGFFEIQDEGSQLVSELVQAKPGDQILDFCSGSGGKSLAIAPKMQGRGQLYLHDIRTAILEQAKKRFRRAGIQNVQFLCPQHPRLLSLHGHIDWVLADVPCSGTGTYRRNPDMKWRASDAFIESLSATQRKIMAEATPFVKKGGFLVYATCSILPQENEEQVDFFLANLPLQLISPPLILHPTSQGADGFFAAVFQKMEASK